MTQEQKTFRQLAKLLAIASIPALALCYGLAQVDSAPFALALVQVLAVVVLGMTAGGAVVCFLASLPGFKGDDAFRS